MRNYIVSILVRNHSGVLRRVAGLFSRRGYNIESLSVGETQDVGVSRITVVVQGDEYIIEQIVKQVSKLIEVMKVERLHSSEAVYRELSLLRISTTNENRSEIIEIINIFRGRVVDIAEKSMIVEITGDSGKVNAFIKAMDSFTILELVRTGLTAMKRGENEFANEE
ncbi:MAG: acetolactate synthase small subunit [Clostridia bacterium]